MAIVGDGDPVSVISTLGVVRQSLGCWHAQRRLGVEREPRVLVCWPWLYYTAVLVLAALGRVSGGDMRLLTAFEF